MNVYRAASANDREPLWDEPARCSFYLARRCCGCDAGFDLRFPKRLLSCADGAVLDAARWKRSFRALAAVSIAMALGFSLCMGVMGWEHLRLVGSLPGPPMDGGGLGGASVTALADLGPKSHDPRVLTRRAVDLAQRHPGLGFVHEHLSESRMGSFGDGERLNVVHDAIPGMGAGLRVLDLDGDSVARAMGVERGDLVTAVNGYSLRDPTGASKAYAEAMKTRGAVLEIVRGVRRVIVSVDW